MRRIRSLEKDQEIYIWNSSNTARQVKASWDNFVMDRLWSNPWNLPYKVVSGKIKSSNKLFESVSYTINDTQFVTQSIEESRAIIDNFITSDNAEEDDAETIV